MPVHKWRRLPTKHFGDVSVPFAQIEIQATDSTFHALALQVDSGAVVSLLRRSVADLLGIELEAGRRVELGSVGTGQTIAYVHQLQTRFADNICYPVPFAIASVERVPNLLGRLEVFDHLQVDFDGTLSETRIAAPWLDHDQRRIWDWLQETERHILNRWGEMPLPPAAAKAATHMVDRAGQVLAGAVGLVKLDRAYAGAVFIRALFEIALQLDYMMEDPGPRAEQYLDFTHMTRYRHVKAVTDNPSGPLARKIAQSPLRAQGERRNQAEYDRVRPRFVRTGKSGRQTEWTNWYGMTIRQLAEEMGRLGEYKLLYAKCCAWAHGDPFSTEWAPSQQATSDRQFVFIVCLGYYARMLLKIADVRQVLLTAEQYQTLKKFAVEWS